MNESSQIFRVLVTIGAVVAEMIGVYLYDPSLTYLLPIINVVTILIISNIHHTYFEEGEE